MRRTGMLASLAGPESRRSLPTQQLGDSPMVVLRVIDLLFVRPFQQSAFAILGSILLLLLC